MNIVKINGSVAEQMFQYGFYLALLQHDPEARLDVPAGKWISSRFRLPRFLEAKPAMLEPFGRGSMKSRLLSRLRKPAGTIVTEPADHACHHELLQATDSYFDGRWLSPRYWSSDVAQALREAFSVPLKQLPASARRIVNMLSQGKSVALHVHEPEAKDGTCTRDYYNWAIANVMSTYRDAHFYVFTTSQQWAEQNLEFNGAKHDFIAYPADQEIGLLPYLYHANHHIVSATLTSWWTAWLCDRPDRIVIAPEQWSKRHTYPDLIPQDWTTIPTT